MARGKWVAQMKKLGCTKRELLEMTGLSEHALQALVANGQLPKPLEIPTREKIWNVRSVEEAWNRLAGAAPLNEHSLLEHLEHV